MNKNHEVDLFLQEQNKWKKEFEILREIILKHTLTEEVKWGVPCYSYNKSNILLMHGFKEYCALLFVKGSLLKDKNTILISQTQNTQSSRQLRFKSVADILNIKTILSSYIDEAIKLEIDGKKVELKQTHEFTMPIEFQRVLDESSQLQSAFSSLTPGRQRAYLLFFDAPKLSKTKEKRIEKYIPHILGGKGLHDV